MVTARKEPEVDQCEREERRRAHLARVPPVAHVRLDLGPRVQTYAADLSRTYSELRRHLHHLTVLHEVSTRIACYMLAVDRVAAMHRLRGMYA